MTTLRWSEGEQCLILENGKKSHLGSLGNFCLRHEDAGPVLCRDIRVALLDALRSGREVIFAVTDDPPTALPSGRLTQLYYIGNHPSEDGLRIEVAIPYIDYDDLQPIEDALKPITSNIECSIEPEENGFVICMWTPDDRHVWEITAFIGLVQQLLPGPPTTFSAPAVAYWSIVTGNANLLIGQAESVWLDAKNQHDFRDLQKKYDLAVDVASFANSADGGLIVVGLATTRDPMKRDIVTSVCGCDANEIDINSCRDSIHQRVFPRICDLAITPAECHGKQLLAIFIPVQSDQSKPFIVSHIVSKSNHKNAHGAMTIPYRTGDQNSIMSTIEVHSLLTGNVPFGHIRNDESN
jgi:hypothetical protein